MIIKLTTESGKEIYVNSDHIQTFFKTEKVSKHTSIYFLAENPFDGGLLRVKETPEEIFTQINRERKG